MCEENVVRETKKYVVQASKYLSVFEDFDTVEEATARIAELAVEGYDMVSLRNHENNSTGEVW